MARVMTGLKTILVGRDIRIGDFSRELGIPYATFNGYLNGYNEPPEDVVQRIAEKLNVRRSDIYNPPFRQDVLINQQTGSHTVK